MDPSDPDYIVVDPTYDEKAHPQQLGNGVQEIRTRLSSSLKQKWGLQDRRAAYKSELYPWLESVDEFTNPYNLDNKSPFDFYSHQGDIARFNFPARSGPGNYIAWYFWSGYVDCVDINVLPSSTPVVHRYGRNATTLGAKQYAIKLDHCEIRFVESAKTMLHVLDPVTRDASICINECINAGFQSCSAVQAVRVTNVEGTLPWQPNIPWTPFLQNATAFFRQEDWPCQCHSPQECHAKGCKRKTQADAAREGFWMLWEEPGMSNANPDNYPNLKDDDYVCFGTKPWRNQDNQVVEDYVVSNDPSDPVWHSTCYLTATSGGFIDIAPEEDRNPPIDWQADDRCLRCNELQSLLKSSSSLIPFWDRSMVPVAADMCADCELCAAAAPEGLPTRAEKLSALTGPDVPFAGLTGQEERQEFEAAQDNAAARNSDTSSRSTLVFGLSRSNSVLVLLAIGVGAMALLAALVYSIVVCRRRGRGDLKRMQHSAAHGGIGLDLQRNPASATAAFEHW